MQYKNRIHKKMLNRLSSSGLLSNELKNKKTMNSGFYISLLFWTQLIDEVHTTNYRKLKNYFENKETERSFKLLQEKPSISIVIAFDHKNGILPTLEGIIKIISEKINTEDFNFNYKNIDIGTDPFNCSEIMIPALSDEVQAVFTTASSECRSLITSYLLKYNILLFALDDTPGEEINKMVLYSSLSASSYRASIDYLMMSKNRRFTILQEISNGNKVIGDYLQNYILNRGGKVVLQLNLDTIHTNYLEIVNSIIQNYPSGTILIIASLDTYIPFDTALFDSKESEKYTLYSYLLSEELRGKAKVPFYSVRACYDKSTNVLFTEFKAKLVAAMETTPLITQQIQLLYTTASMFLESIINNTLVVLDEEKTIIKIDELHKKLHEPYNSILGTIYYSANNGLSLPTFLIGTDEKIITSTAVAKFTVWSTPINKANYLCDIFSENIGEKYRLGLKYIGIFLTLNGDDTDPAIFDQITLTGILFSIEFLNSQLTITDKQYYPIVNTVRMEEYREGLNIFLSRKDISLYIGGITHEERVIISEETKIYKKYWFYLGYNSLYKCDPYILSYNVLPNQVLESSLKILSSSTYNDFLLIYGTDSLETHYYNVYQTFFNTVGLYKITSITAFPSNFETIKTLIASNQKMNIFIFMITNNVYYSDLLALIPANREVYHIFGDPTGFTTINGLLDATNHYLMMTFSIVFGDKSDKLYSLIAEKYFNAYTDYNYDLHRVSLYTEISYSILISYHQASTILSTEDMEEILDYLYDRSIAVPSGIISLSTNNFVYRSLYGAVIQNRNPVMVYSSQTKVKPDSFSDLGNITNINRFCDVSKLKTDLYITKDSKLLLLVLESTVREISDSLSTLVFIRNDLVTYNNKGGHLGIEVNTVPIFIDTSNEKDLKALEEAFDTLEFDAIMGCKTDKCKEIVQKYSISKKIVFFSFSQTSTNICSPYTFNLLNSPNQRIKTILEFAVANEVDYLYGIIETEEE